MRKDAMSSRQAPVRLDSSGDAQAIVAELQALLAGLSDGKLTPGEVDPAGHLFDFGYVDSLSAVMFLEQIETRWGLRIDDLELLETYHSLERLAAHLAARSG
jgi:acyl carrier protein